MMRLYKQGGLSPAILSIFQPQRAQQVAWVRSMIRDAHNEHRRTSELKNLKTVIIDLETTGFNAYAGDEIISIGAIRMTGGVREADQPFYTLVQPTCSIPVEITHLTGISYEMVRNSPSLLEALQSLMEYMDNRILIAHFSRHDQSFLQQALWKTCKSSWNYRFIDTVMVARLLFPERISYELEELLSLADVPLKTRHHALMDAEMTGDLWSFYIEEAQTRNLNTLEDLLNYNRNTRMSDRD